MADTDGIRTLADAFRTAETESGLGGSDATDAALPAAEADDFSEWEHAETEVVDQPSEVAEESHDEILELLEFAVDDEETATEAAPTFDWNLSVEVSTVDGPQTVTLAELRDGYMMRADYTRKTQELAEQRRQQDEAIKFYEELRSHPSEVVAYLAEQAGFIKEGQRPIREVDFAFPTPEQVTDMVEARAKELIENDPRVQEAEIVAARARVNEEFGRIEQTHDVTLSQEARRKVMQEAVRLGIDSLETTYELLVARANRKRQQSDALRKSAPSRPGSRPAQAEPGEAKPKDIFEAAAMAAAELGL